MSLYRIWIDDGKHNEAEDGEEVEAETSGDAVLDWGWTRYSALQHVDPGVVLVRYLPAGSVVRFRLRTRVEIDVTLDAVVEDNGDGA